MTGLTPDDISGLAERDRKRLATWHGQMAGNDDGRPFFGGAIRALPVEQRLALANDGEYLAIWIEAERRKAVADPAYFTEGYGHVQPERQGADPIPFAFWPMFEDAAERAIGARSQREVMEAFFRERIVVVLKARQLGLTWMALHFGYWLMGFAEDLPRAKVLILSKTEDDANKQVVRLRKINALLPPFLKHPEDRETKWSASKFKLAERGQASSLVSTPRAARGEQADLLVWDEAAFARNQSFEETWTAAESTLGDYGRAVVISTGNGPAEAPGDGQGFAQLYGQALTGEEGMLGVFLPDDVHPKRNEEARERRRRRYLSDTSYEQEHPLTMEEALAGQQGTKVYPLAGIAAAVRLGAVMDAALASGTLPEPTGASDGRIAGGFDWGVYTHLLGIWELEHGGVYVPPGEVASFAEEVSDKAFEWHRNVRDLVQEPYGGARGLLPKIGEGRFDSAGIEQMRVFVGVVQKHPELWPQWELVRTSSRANPAQARTLSVRFNEWKAFTIAYLQYLFARTARGETHGVIAISPQNTELVRQLRALEFLDDGTGRLKKLDDHGPDALIAGTAGIAAAHGGRPEVEGEEEDELAVPANGRPMLPV